MDYFDSVVCLLLTLEVRILHMGNLQRSLVIMLEESGCDVHLLQDADRDPVDRMTMMFSPREQTILWQYECGSEPVVLLSKFFQLDVPTSHLFLVHLRARIVERLKRLIRSALIVRLES
jgi:hypothetical protein